MKAYTVSIIGGCFLLLLSGITTMAPAQSRIMSAQEITSEINSMKDEVTRLQAEINTLEADNRILSSQLENTLAVTQAPSGGGSSTLAVINLFLFLGLAGGMFVLYRYTMGNNSGNEFYQNDYKADVNLGHIDQILDKIQALERKVTALPARTASESTVAKVPDELTKSLKKIDTELTTLKVIQKELEGRITENEDYVKNLETEAPAKKTKKKSSPKKKKEDTEPVPSLFDLIEDEVQASFSQTDDSDYKELSEEPELKANEPEETAATSEPKTESDTSQKISSAEPDEDDLEVAAEPEKTPVTAVDISEFKEEDSEEDDLSFDFNLDEPETEETESITDELSDESAEPIEAEDNSLTEDDEEVEETVKALNLDLGSRSDVITEQADQEKVKEPVADTKSEMDETEQETKAADVKKEDFGSDFWEAVEALEEDKPGAVETAEKPDNQAKHSQEPVEEKVTEPVKKPDAKASLNDALARMRKLTERGKRDTETKQDTTAVDKAEVPAEISTAKPKQEKPDSQTQKSAAEVAKERNVTAVKEAADSSHIPKVNVTSAGKSKLADSFEERLQNLKEPEQYAISARNYPEETEIKENWALALIRRGYKRSYDDDIIDAINLMEEVIKSGGRKEGLAHQIMADGMYTLGLIKGEKNFFNRANIQYKKVTEKSGYDGVSMYTNWGNSLINLYYITNKNAFLNEALDKFKIVNNIYTHAGDYNIARVFNLMGNQQVAMEWIESAFKYKLRLPTIDEIMRDTALKSVIHNPHFDKLIKKYNVK